MSESHLAVVRWSQHVHALGGDMSDTSQGQNWWQASDGKWYPPETHPDYVVPLPPPPPTPSTPTPVDPPVQSEDDILWRHNGKSWRCTSHDRKVCLRCQMKADPPPTGAKAGDTWGKNTTLSNVGVRTQDGLACPGCGGTNFTARRSANGIFVAGVWAPKSQVKCVTCGRVFKRG
jgi:hypothetical protein